MYLLIKPASGACDLRCRYCFYADEMENRTHAVRKMMSCEDIETIIERALVYISSLSERRARTLSLGFQGGEPTLAGLGFYRCAVDAVKRFNSAKIPVSWFLQTNGMHIDREWAIFLAENHFLAGLSLDGTSDLHDKNRIRSNGGGTHSAILRAARILREAGADFNIITVLTGDNARSPQKLYNYFKKQGFIWQQYIPCIAPLGCGDTVWTLTPEKYGDFLCRLFDLWYDDLTSGMKRVYNREFENWIGILAGIEPEECGMRGICSEQYLIESDGSVYPCDFYALDEYCLGNILTDSFVQIDKKREEIGFISASLLLPDECRECQWLPLCRGGCRRNRDENGKNRFCEAYKKFFTHALPRMQHLASTVRH